MSKKPKQSLGQKTVGGGLATVFGQVAMTVINLVATGILARILMPSDFGLLAKVAAITGIVTVIGDLGLSLATIQSETINKNQLSALFHINVIAGVGLSLIIASASPLIAWFYDDPRVLFIALALSMNILIGSFGVQHIAILKREMRFNEIAIIQIVALILASLLAIASARWLGYWALLVQLIGKTTFRSTSVWIIQKFRPSLKIRGTGIRQHLKMGGNFTVAKFANFAARNADNILIGKAWGEDILGYYSKAYSLLVLPLSQLAGPMSQVAVPALSRMQSEPDRYRVFFRKGVSIALLLQFPIAFFAGIAGRDIILIILGPKWEASVPFFLALVPNLIASAIAPATTWVVLSTGQTARYLKIAVFNSVIVVISFIISVQFGVLALAWTFSVTTCLLRIPTILYVFKTAPVEPSDFFNAIWIPIAISSTATLVTLLLINSLALQWILLSFGCKLMVFSTVYLGLASRTKAGKSLIDQLIKKWNSLRFAAK